MRRTVEKTLMRTLGFVVCVLMGLAARAEETEHSTLILKTGIEERNEVYSPPPATVYHSQYDNPAAVLPTPRATPRLHGGSSAHLVKQVVNAGLFRLENAKNCGAVRPPCFLQSNSDLGIQAGDQLESINGLNYPAYIRVGRTPDDIARLLNRGRTQPMTLVIRRNGRLLPPMQVMWGFEWHGQSF